MSLSPNASGARDAAEEIVPMPVLPRLFRGRAVARQIEGRRHSVERIIGAHCIDRKLGVQAWRALSSEANRLALSGRSIPPDMAQAIAALEAALGIE